MLRRLTLAASVILFSVCPLSAGQDRAETVRKDKGELADDEFWIYNDLDAGIAEAKRSGKPLLIVFR